MREFLMRKILQTAENAYYLYVLLYNFFLSPLPRRRRHRRLLLFYHLLCIIAEKQKVMFN